MWLFFLGLATNEIGRLACGEGCAVVTAAYNLVSVAAGVTVVLVLPFSVSVLLMASMMARAQAAATTATDIEATKEPALKTSYAAVRETLCDSLALGVAASMAFTLLMLIGDLVKWDSPVMGSRRERVGSVIHDVGALGTFVVNSFVSCPIITVRIWRASRMARHAL
ncbi:hypothetical protein SORBI_3007G128100 [Sorghum bicolor]|nr:hypothetical protein SORBI_3007G128100 [Sorghum bicolor]